VNVDVKVDSAGAETKLAAVAASEDKVDKGNVRVAKSGQDAGKGMGALATAVITLGPALVPLAAGTAGLAVGFGAMGAAGILAIVGIKQEMTAGTALGASYTAMLGTLKGDLTTLGHTAASGVLAPFQTSVADLQKRMPALNSIIGEFSGITGRTAGVLTTGLVAAFIALAPLARDAGVYVLGLSTKFAAMMSGPGVVSFGDYVRSVFPQVMQAVESIVGASVRLVAALAPLGLGTLGILRTFADVLTALPVDVLAALAQTAGSVYIGFKAFSLLDSGITNVGKALAKVGVSAEAAAGGLRTMQIAAGVIGAIITVATLLYSAHAESVRQDSQAVNDLTDALIRSGGVIDDNTVKEQANKLAKDGTLQAAKLLGYGIGDVTAASLGSVPAMDRVTAHTQDLIDKYGGVAPAAEKAGKSIDDGIDAFNKVNDATKNGSKNLGLASQAYSDYTAATKTSTGTTTAATLAEQESTLAHLSGTDATKAQKQALTELNTEMSAELGLALMLAGATSGYDSALLTMTETLKKNNGTLSEHTREGISDRQAIESTAQALQSKRAQEIQTGTSTAAATIEYQKNSSALLVQMGKLYGTKSAAYVYMQQLLAIPKDVKTAVGLNIGPAAAAARALQAQIDALHGKTITMYTQTVNAGFNPSGMTRKANGGIAFLNGGITAFANGGENHVAQIAPAGAMRLWAEPETGGEAYIPLARSKRARSTAILNEVERKFGVGGSGGGGQVQQITVYLGDRQITDIVRVEVDGHTQALTDALVYGGH
jgi:hypothetical protein